MCVNAPGMCELSESSSFLTPGLAGEVNPQVYGHPLKPLKSLRLDAHVE